MGVPEWELEFYEENGREPQTRRVGGTRKRRGKRRA
jgi:hypothetical protein